MNFKDEAETPTEQPLLSASLSMETSQNRSVLPADWRPMGSVSPGKPNWAVGWAQAPPVSTHRVYTSVHRGMVKFMVLPQSICAWSRSSLNPGCPHLAKWVRSPPPWEKRTHQSVSRYEKWLAPLCFLS